MHNSVLRCIYAIHIFQALNTNNYMSNEEFYPMLSTKILIDEIQKQLPQPEYIDELEESLKCFLAIIAICDILPYLILTGVLFITFPFLAPLGIIRILFLLARSFKNFQKLIRS